MNPVLRQRWADTIKEHRRQRGLSQAALAQECDVDQTTVSRWERATLIPTEDGKIRLAEVFGYDDARHMFPLALPRASEEPSAAAQA